MLWSYAYCSSGVVLVVPVRLAVHGLLAIYFFFRLFLLATARYRSQYNVSATTLELLIVDVLVCDS
jgi:hypothetical protein